MENLTPAMKQYMEIKNKYKDCIVFFRMGDFYETFYDDAKITSKTLDITLTKRGIRNSEKSIPLAGIPYHALDSYLNKMIKNGFKVAIVEQLEDPSKAKGIVKRDVVRVVTPGTIIDEKMLSKNNNFIASLSVGEKYGLAFIDISTGEFLTTELNNIDEVLNELGKYYPGELILPMSFESDEKFIQKIRNRDIYISFRSDVDFFIDNAKSNLKKHFNIISLDGFGLKKKDFSVSSSGALLSYLYETQKNNLSHINNLRYYSNKDYLLLDPTTITNLELLNSKDKMSLLKVLDMTLTSMGSRRLKNFLLKPLINIQKINERLLSVEELQGKHFVLEELRDLLKNIADLERLISRINYGNSNPRDLVLLHASIDLIPAVKRLLEESETSLLIKLKKMDKLGNISSLIDSSIVDEPPVNVAEGNFIKKGYDEELDKYRNLRKDAKSIMKDIEVSEREKTGIKSLKIKYNKIFGYYIDITKPNIHLVPETYIKKQTLVNSERFITEELKGLEEQILSADEKIIKIEQELFDEIIEIIKKETNKIQHIADNIAYLDVICSFAKVSLINNYTKPIVNDNYRIIMKESRHPVVEKITDFVSNDVFVDKNNSMMIITGPNMAGKSVYMKQVALNVIMAQIGCFVACDYSEIGVVDKIFSRTGATDDISVGHSTFMIEMNETAHILNNSTQRSLIILDEIGRGTSTYDGVAIAWAVAEHIALKLKAKTLFATHYHVLNNLEKEIPNIKNYNIAVKEIEGKIIFIRKILPGGTDKSYGIHVAKLAGIPKEVIDRSKEIQFKLEKDDEISEKIIIETRKTEEKDDISKEIEETERLIKSRQLTLNDV